MALNAQAFGERLVFARTRAGLSQAQLAERANVSKRALESYEAGVRVPRTAAPMLAWALDVDVDWLLLGDREFVPDLSKMAAELEGLVAQMSRALGLSERVWAAFRERFEAVEARLAAIESMLERDVELDRKIYESISDGREGVPPRRPPAAPARPLEHAQHEPE